MATDEQHPVIWMQWEDESDGLPCRMVVRTEKDQPVFYAEILDHDALGNVRWDQRRVVRDNNSAGLIYHFLVELYKRQIEALR